MGRKLAIAWRAPAADNAALLRLYSRLGGPLIAFRLALQVVADEIAGRVLRLAALLALLSCHRSVPSRGCCLHSTAGRMGRFNVAAEMGLASHAHYRVQEARVGGVVL